MADKNTASQSQIRVVVKIFGGLRTQTFPELGSFPLPKDATIDRLLAEISQRSPELISQIEDGLAAGYLNILVNGRNIRFLGNRATVLRNADTIAFLPPVGGG